MWQEIMEKVFWDRLGWIGLAAKWSTQSKEKIKKKYTENSYFVKCPLYEGHLESKERFSIKKYLLIIGKKKNMQVLSHTFTYFST